jgi:hypothetical protein
MGAAVAAPNAFICYVLNCNHVKYRFVKLRLVGKYHRSYGRLGPKSSIDT